MHFLLRNDRYAVFFSFYGRRDARKLTPLSNLKKQTTGILAFNQTCFLGWTRQMVLPTQAWIKGLHTYLMMMFFAFMRWIIRASQKKFSPEG